MNLTRVSLLQGEDAEIIRVRRSEDRCRRDVPGNGGRTGCSADAQLPAVPAPPFEVTGAARPSASSVRPSTRFPPRPLQRIAPRAPPASRRRARRRARAPARADCAAGPARPAGRPAGSRADRRAVVLITRQPQAIAWISAPGSSLRRSTTARRAARAPCTRNGSSIEASSRTSAGTPCRAQRLQGVFGPLAQDRAAEPDARGRPARTPAAAWRSPSGDQPPHAQITGAAPGRTTDRPAAQRPAGAGPA